jgi:hypothetical protein
MWIQASLLACLLACLDTRLLTAQILAKKYMRLILLVVLALAACAAQADGAAPATEPVEAAEPVEAPTEAAQPAEATTEAAAPPTPDSKSKAQPKSPLRLAVALRAARPWSFPATVSPVLFGSALAFQVEDRFGPLKLLLTLGTTLSAPPSDLSRLHATTRLIRGCIHWRR